MLGTDPGTIQMIQEQTCHALHSATLPQEQFPNYCTPFCGRHTPSPFPFLLHGTWEGWWVVVFCCCMFCHTALQMGTCHHHAHAALTPGRLCLPCHANTTTDIPPYTSGRWGGYYFLGHFWGREGRKEVSSATTYLPTRPGLELLLVISEHHLGLGGDRPLTFFWRRAGGEEDTLPLPVCCSFLPPGREGALGNAIPFRPVEMEGRKVGGRLGGIPSFPALAGELSTYLLGVPLCFPMIIVPSLGGSAVPLPFLTPPAFRHLFPPEQMGILETCLFFLGGGLPATAICLPPGGQAHHRDCFHGRQGLPQEQEHFQWSREQGGPALCCILLKRTWDATMPATFSFSSACHLMPYFLPACLPPCPPCHTWEQGCLPPSCPSHAIPPPNLGGGGWSMPAGRHVCPFIIPSWRERPSWSVGAWWADYFW